MNRIEIEFFKWESIVLVLNTRERKAVGIESVDEEQTQCLPKSLLDKILANETTLDELRKDKANFFFIKNEDILEIEK